MMAREKISEAEKIEADNLLEEASEIFSSCVRCGMCKALCPVFRVLKEEGVSARGKGILLWIRLWIRFCLSVVCVGLVRSGVRWGLRFATLF